MRESMEGFRLLTLYCFLFSSMRIATATLDTITLGQSISDGETLVSADQRFELGFFSPGTSRSRYLGIWYKKVAPKTTVWVANRDNPISDPSGVLHINAGGILVLLNSTKDIVWSSNASRSPENPVAVLLGSGNLAVKDGNDNNPANFLWQNFDHPGNTLLPGMKLGINLVTGLEWSFTSWKSNDDPSHGEFTMLIDPRGFPQPFLKKGPVILYRTGSWNGLHWTGYPKLKPNSMYSDNFVSNEKEAPLDCQHADGFLKLEAVKLPDTSHSRAEKYISLVECKKLCLSNCSCTAYASLDIREGGSGCLLWFNDLIDIRDIEGGQDLYVRVAASELGNIESRRQPSGKKHVNVIIIVASIISGMGALVLAWIMYMRKTKLKNEGHTDDNHEMDDNEEGSRQIKSLVDPVALDFSSLFVCMRESMKFFRILILYCFLFSSPRIANTTQDTITLGQSIRDGETVVSADQRFELGFFSPGTSRSRYLGIWYKKVTPKTTVWVANRNTPISDPSGILNINARGILVLLNSTNNTVWSSNASRTPQNPVSVLLGSGNLAMKDGNDNNPDNFLWQSFDYPGETLLQGMKLGINLVTGLEWFFTSWKSTDDPSQGEFTEMIDPRGTPQLFLKKGPVILYRAGSWNGLHWTGSPQLKPNSIYAYNFVSNEKEVFYTYDIQDSSVLSRVVLTPSGVVQRFTWMDQTRTWVEYYAKTRDECDNYAKCGAYAICNVNNFPVCTCFEKFKPKSQRQWSLLNSSAGCVRKAPLYCKHGDGFLKLEAIKLPDTIHSRTEKYISLVECKKLCLSNCSCTAYATLDIREGGSGCLLWFNDLIDIRDIEGGQDLYVRVAASELGNIESRRQPSGKKHVNVIIIVASIISGMGALVLAWIMYMRKTKLKNEGRQIKSLVDPVALDFSSLFVCMRESMKFFRILILYCFLFSSPRIANTTQDTITLGQSIRDGETVVSADQRFELGFFSPGTSRSRYLGIWYKKVTPKTTVWVANRNTPISDPSGILNINARGILVLLNSTNNTVWSSNASRTPQNPVSVLLGSGNLAMKDGNDNNPDNFLWQSFDYPGETLLQGMKLGINLVTGLEWFFTSWKSTDDPSQGEFTEMIDPRGTPQLFLKKGPVILYRAGSWNGLHWTGSPQLKPNSIYAYNFVSNEKEVFYTYDIQDSSVLSRVVLTPSGVVQRFTWMDQTRTWVEYYAKTRDECDNYAKCGAYAICNVNNFPVCTCFEKFKPKSQRQWSLLNSSAGCVRKAPLYCKHGDGFLKLEAIKLPDTIHSRTEKYISLVECKKLCLSNCSCTAYATLDIREGGSGCLLWFNDLIDIRDIEGGQDLYVRVAASELGNIESRRQPSGKKHVNVIIIVASIISGMGALVLAWIMYMRKTKLKNEGR
ncbi:hypothetical protein EZV62_006596 [Acer yangbiense]|uniref:Non-specific serine/threonine protein kinase n=1 Tax=Acer yangbiense TaxID=1000413 RepID=A0A5C7I827_9ROSI|nr:hypothetical protein EZV62_006596 [Acer yangbiense]